MSTRHLSPLTLTATMRGSADDPTEPDIPLSELQAAPTSLVVNDRTVPVTAEIWRDLMPSVIPQGSPLAVLFHLPDDAPAVTVTRLWVVLGNQVWPGTASRATASTTWVARNGPQWPEHASTDVIAEILLTPPNTVLVRVPGVVIRGAY